MRVLAIDDHPIMIKALKRMLKDCDVVTASSVKAAMDALDEYGHFDHILCDMMIDGETGMQFLDEVKKRYPALAKKIIFCTAGGTTKETADFLKKTTHPVVQKPFNLEDLKKVCSW